MKQVKMKDDYYFSEYLTYEDVFNRNYNINYIYNTYGIKFQKYLPIYGVSLSIFVVGDFVTKLILKAGEYLVLDNTIHDIIQTAFIYTKPVFNELVIDIKEGN